MLLKQLQAGDPEQAAALLALMAKVFGKKANPLSAAYLDQLLNQGNFWAFDGEQVLGGVTTHTLPMTRNETDELFIYDLAVNSKFQRQWICRSAAAPAVACKY